MASNDCAHGLEPNSYVTHCADTEQTWGRYVSSTDVPLEPGAGTFVRAEEPAVRRGAYTDSAHQ